MVVLLLLTVGVDIEGEVSASTSGETDSLPERLISDEGRGRDSTDYVRYE